MISNMKKITQAIVMKANTTNMKMLVKKATEVSVDFNIVLITKKKNFTITNMKKSSRIHKYLIASLTLNKAYTSKKTKSMQRQR